MLMLLAQRPEVNLWVGLHITLMRTATLVEAKSLKFAIPDTSKAHESFLIQLSTAEKTFTTTLRKLVRIILLDIIATDTLTLLGSTAVAKPAGGILSLILIPSARDT